MAKPSTTYSLHQGNFANPSKGPPAVTSRIYALNGALDLGHQPAGNYQSKGRAAHWDGRNELGERVASGLYFYTLTAGEFTATRKMLMRK